MELSWHGLGCQRCMQVCPSGQWSFCNVWCCREKCVLFASCMHMHYFLQVQERLAHLLSLHNNSMAGRTANAHQRQRNMMLMEALCGQLEQVCKAVIDW